MAAFQDFLALGIVICLGFSALNPDGHSQGAHHAMKCENETMAIICPVHTTIYTIKVEYGQSFSGNHCIVQPYGQGRDGCLSTRALSAFNQRCENKRTCSITVDKGTFKDRPCDIGIPIYLHVTYVCVPLSLPALPFTPGYTPAIVSQTSNFPEKEEGYTPIVVSQTSNLSEEEQGYPPVIVSQTSTFSEEEQGYTPEKMQSYIRCVGCAKCFSSRKRDINWPEIPAGEWATALCPNNPNLYEARLLCGTDPVDWVGHPDLSKCTSSKVVAIQMQLKNTKDLNVQSLDLFANEIVDFAEAEKSLAGGDLIGISESMYQVVKKCNKLASSDRSPSIKPHLQHLSMAVLKMTDNLLDDEQSVLWKDVPKTGWGSLATRMMTTVEASAFQMARAFNSAESRVNITKNILVDISVIKAETSSSSVNDIVFPNADALKGSPWENVHDSFRIPAGALPRDRRTTVLFTSYNNLENLLLPNNSDRTFCSALDNSEDCDAIINSRIISASIDSHGMNDSEIFSNNPVFFTLEHKKTENVSNPICAFWKLSAGDEEGGEWSDEGCLVEASNLTHTTCSCNHLTSFAVIMSPTSPEMTIANAIGLDVLTYIGCGISIICLLLSLLTFSYFESLQCDRNTIHKNLVLCLLISNMIFLIGIDLASLKIFCSIIAGFLHYFLLTVFAWMCIEGVQLYYMLVEVFEVDKSHVLWFYLSAYGVPAVIVLISAAVNHQGYGTDRYCWLTTNKGFVSAFLVPAAAIILFNCVMLCIALRAMYRHSVSAATWRMKEKSRLQQFRSWVKGSVVLIVLLGLTWAFGIAFVNEATIAFAYIFTILNSLQGLFIFIFHCLLNDKVQLEYKRCVRKAEWLPHQFRVWYAGLKRSSYTSSPNITNSSTGGWQWVRLLSRRRRNSQSSSLSRTASQKRLSLKKQELTRQNIVIGSDSGFEDPSSYLESAQSHFGESEFNAFGLSSALEGSVVDADYCEKLGLAVSKGLEETEDMDRQSETA